MRRTYKSKKDTTSVIERRDLFQNLDDRSAAYNAFSIQNIKQTKRELSCIGSSNPLGVTSSKVRKKKFVKRIAKNVETPCRENSSVSTYLTPDKSIRVNKPLDPFDLLLMSSPAGPVETTRKEVESVASKVDLFDQKVSKKEGRAYTRRKPNKTKKINYSRNDSYDTDKENSNYRPNITQNTSDIRAHDLLVEKVFNNKPKLTDDSINNIVNNIALLNRLKHKYSSDDSINKSLIFNRHRLTKNILSPLSQKSPLCSTPFKAKYRGESIFKFSPISATSRVASPKKSSLTEDNDDSNCSVVLLDSVKDYNTEENALNLNPNSSVKREENSEPVGQIETGVEAETLSHKIMEVPSLVTNEKSSVEINSLQTTEIEPFLGFSNDADTEKFIDYGNLVVSLQDIDGNILRSQVFVSEDIRNEYSEENNEIAQNTHCYEYDLNSHNNNNYIITNNNSDDSSEQSTDEDRGSLYDTCTSEQSSIIGRVVQREPVILLERMNDTLFYRYYDVMNYKEIDSDDVDNTESGSFEDCKDLKVSSSSNIESDTEDNLLEKKTEYNNEEIESNDDEMSSNSENESNNDDGLSNNSENESNNDYELSNNSENESNNDDEMSSNSEEEKCISFVTTRRRNGVTNNSMMSMFNDSNYSSSTNCDNTVLSNYMETKPDANTDLDVNAIERNNEPNREDDEIIDLNKDSEHSDEAPIEDDTRISFVTTRSSNVTDRKSSIRSRKSSLKRISDTALIGPSDLSRQSIREESRMSCFDGKPGIVLQPGKKWERSLSIYRRMTMMTDQFDRSILEDEPMEAKGRKYRQSVISTMEMQEFNSSLHNESINSRRSTFVSKPSRSTIRIVKDPNSSRLSLSKTTTLLEDLKGFWNEECDDTIIELSKLSITDHTHEVTVLDNFHDTSNRIVTAKDYVLRRCNQTEPILFDECYPDLLLKNCHKIGEGVYGEVYLWRDRDGRARVLKIVPIAGNIKVNGESQKDFHEIISEIVIAMELSALRAPIAEIERHFDEEKDVKALDLHAIENATDVFNEVLAVRCVYGSYPSRLLDLWDLYDECKGSENDNPAILPVDQQYIVLELANAGQDLESYQFNNAEQAHALFLQVAYGLAVAEEAFQFEHRDLHWGNVLIAPTEQKFATFVIRGRAVRVPRCGVRATVIDYSLSRVALRLGSDSAALYNDLAADESLFDAVGDYQFQVYRLMREKLGNDWKNFEPYTNILWLHYTVDKMITALRYKRTNTKTHKHYIDKLKGIKSRILDYGSAAQFVLTDNEI